LRPISDEEKDEEAEAMADGDADIEGEREGEQRSGSEKAESGQEEEAEKSDASAKEGSDGGLFYFTVFQKYYKHFIKFYDGTSVRNAQVMEVLILLVP
jgi:hypothetical protein